jgi:hypothetical protein
MSMHAWHTVHEYENKTRNTPAIFLSICHALRKHCTPITNTTPFLQCWELVGACVENHTKPVQYPAGKNQCFGVLSSWHVQLPHLVQVSALSGSVLMFIIVVQDLLTFTEADIKDLGVKNSAHRARVVSSLVALRTKHEKGKCLRSVPEGFHYCALHFCFFNTVLWEEWGAR